MLTGSALGFRYPPALTSRPQYIFSRNSALGRRTALALLPRNRNSSTSHVHNVLEQRNALESRVASAMNSFQGSSTHLLPSRRTASANGTRHPLIFSGISALPADKKSVIHTVGTDSLVDSQDHGLDTPRTRQPHRAPVHTARKCPALRRRTLLWLILTTKSPDRAWTAYQDLLSSGAVIPHHLLHRLVRLLASIKPRTRTVHLQLLSVLETLQRNGGRVRLWEWNTLIDSAGKHWHKTRLEDYENALDIFNKRGALLTGQVASVDKLHTAAGSCATQQDPDIWTYNILLSIASRSNLPLAVRHASSLLLASQLPLNRYTHLCLLRYFAARKDMQSVCSTLRKMKQQGLKVGLDGINSCLWAYARNGRFDVALRIYRVLRSNIRPRSSFEEHDIDEDSHYINEATGLDTLDGLEPDEITYTIMIQTLAYHGDLSNAISIFVDMLSTRNREAGACTVITTDGPAYYKPSMAAFRGIFLGFARHGRHQEHRIVNAEPIGTLFPSTQDTWDQDTLETVFAAFLQLPSRLKPTDRILYWILVAFDRTSGSDTAKLREVWTKLEAKYGGGWGGRLEDIRRSIFASEDQKTLTTTVDMSTDTSKYAMH